MGANLILPAGGAAAAAAYPVDYSCRFDGSTSYLSRTFGAGDRRKWTFAAWVKRAGITGARQELFSAGVDTDSSWSDAGLFELQLCNYWGTESIHVQGGTTHWLDTSAVYRDVAAWMHICLLVDTQAGADADKMKLYVNGELVTSYDTDNRASLVDDLAVNNNTARHTIGVWSHSLANFELDAYLADIHFIDGTAIPPDGNFIETDSNGQWVPKEYTGDDYGTNGFHLDFSDSAELGADASGNANDFTATNIGPHDQMLDSPSAGKNYCTFNPLDGLGSAITLSEGNLHSDAPSVAYGQAATGRRLLNWYIETGTWLVEFRLGPDTYSGGQVNCGFHIAAADDESEYCDIYDSSTTAAGGGLSVTGTAGNWDDEDIIGLAIDFDSGTRTVKVYHNGTLTSTVSGFSVNEFYIQNGIYGTAGEPGTESWLNCGQDPTFSGTHTTSEAEFAYPVTGYNALCTANLAAPGVNNAVTPVFATALYSGDATAGGSATTTTVTFDNGDATMQPDLVWLKDRTTSNNNHVIHDSVRGASAFLLPNATAAESSSNVYGAMSSFHSDGFVVSEGSHSLYGPNRVNLSGSNYVGWCWKANGSTSPSANTAAGFSIVKYTGTWDAMGYSGDNPQSVSHSLGVAPELMLIKDRDNSGSWVVYHKDLDTASGEYLVLDTDAAVETSMSDDPFYAESPTNSVFKVASDSSGAGTVDINTDSTNYIAYLFASVEGYSKVGSYTGNGAVDGPFVHLGFRPAFVMFKRTDSTGSWRIHDADRNPYNYVNKLLSADTIDTEITAAGDFLDFTSDGVKLRATATDWNASDGTYIFYAVAENPFKYANAR